MYAEITMVSWGTCFCLTGWTMAAESCSLLYLDVNSHVTYMMLILNISNIFFSFLMTLVDKCCKLNSFIFFTRK